MSFFVYLLDSRRHGTLYLGVTNDLVCRVYEHKTKAVPGFTARYEVDRLVWYETYDEPVLAITREKELKKWRRDWKIRLIEEVNPECGDLYQTILGLPLDGRSGARQQPRAWNPRTLALGASL